MGTAPPLLAWRTSIPTKELVGVKRYVVGSRASTLARAQVSGYLALLRNRSPDVEFVRREIREGGDEDRISPLKQVSERTGSSAFSSSQEEALVLLDVDFVVHSLKDVPTGLAPGTLLVPPPGREDVRDALCGSTLAALQSGARVGTGSARRRGQLRALRPDVEIVPIRGNVPPRLRLRSSMKLDAVVLAGAGLHRLGLEHEITELLPPKTCPPSPGQGALGIQVREDDMELRDLLEAVGDSVVDAQVRAERAMLAELHGGCTVPIGAMSEVLPDGSLTLLGQVTSLDGKQQLTRQCAGPAADPEALGKALAAELLSAGAGEILRAVRAQSAAL
ncbi:hydroxymethylbilane synthase [Streptomyces sp. NPDC059564]|uniref:hydroxymethylbilane synthase n=1 Tax=Streptomyces sp. NPDC059564 TaxID=3346865 RepID=UPI00367597CF